MSFNLRILILGNIMGFYKVDYEILDHIYNSDDNKKFSAGVGF